MSPYLRVRCKRFTQLNTDDGAQLLFDVWVHYLQQNEMDHLNALYDIQYALDVYETQEEYEICAVLHHIIEQYPKLSQLKLR